MSEHSTIWRNGAIKAVTPDGETACNPGDPLFSTLTMIATHYYRDGEWIENIVHGEDDDEDGADISDPDPGYANVSLAEWRNAYAAFRARLIHH